jgi:hypothetical protein
VTVTVGNVPTSPVAKTPGFQNTTVTKGSSRVHSEVHMNGVVYVASYSDHTYDYSSGVQVDRTSTPYLTAYNRATGAVITTWNCALNGGVQELCLVNAGAQLAICGAFTSCCGSARGLVAMVNTLSGPSDTSAAALATGFGNMALSGGEAKAMWPNARGETQLATDTLYVGGNFTGKAVKIKKTSGTWAVDGGWNPSTSVSSGYVQCLTAKSDHSKVFLGGTIPNSCALVDGATGAAQAFGVGWTATGAQHCIGCASDDTYLVFGGDAGPNIAFVTDWAGSGPRPLPAGGTGAHGYDYYEPQGNIQGVGLIYTTTSPTGKMWALCHHDVLGAPTTSSSAAGFSTFGILGIQYGANTNGTAVLWANPPKVAGSGVEILKCWGATQDRGPDQSYRVGLMGDYLSVNGDTTKIRYAAFAPSVTGGPPPPPPPPANSWTCPSDHSADTKFFSVLETATDALGNTTQVRSNIVGPIGVAGAVPVNTVAPAVDATSIQAGFTIHWTPGTWTNTPTSHTYQMQRRQTGNSTIISTVSSATSYTTLVTDIGYDVRFEETETNASGSGAPAFSPWTTIVPPIENPPVVPTIILTQPPNDITLIGNAGDAYTVVGTVTSDSAINFCFVNNQLVEVDDFNAFSRVISLSLGANLVTVVAADNDDDTSTLTHTITLAQQGGGGGGGGGGSGDGGDVAQSSDLLRLERELGQRGLE